MTQFIKMIQLNFEKINKHQETVRRKMETSFDNLEMQLGQVSSHLALKLIPSEDFYENMLDSTRDAEIEREFKQECEVVVEGGVEKEKEEEKCTPSDKEIKERIEE